MIGAVIKSEGFGTKYPRRRVVHPFVVSPADPFVSSKNAAIGMLSLYLPEWKYSDVQRRIKPC
jgi:hypothetical protein